MRQLPLLLLVSSLAACGDDATLDGLVLDLGPVDMATPDGAPGPRTIWAHRSVARTPDPRA